MKTYSKVDLYNMDNINNTLGEYMSYREMSSDESSFLCGLIQQKKPKHILEVGVAAGASTAVILSCVQELGLNCKVDSVDLCKPYYRDDTKETGYVADILKHTAPRLNEVDHQKHLGNTVAYYLDDICAERGMIDFLILDTTHSLPGELLDFVAALPYLEDGAIVVLHDVSLHLTRTGEYVNNYATRTLFCVVTADKYYMPGIASNIFSTVATDKCDALDSNIAAFQITDETRENVIDIFSALLLPWQYDPGEALIEQYHKCIRNHYSDSFSAMLGKITQIQASLSQGGSVDNHLRTLLSSKWMKGGDSVFLYGGGFWAKKYLAFARSIGLPLAGIIISDDHDLTAVTKADWLDGTPVYHISDLPKEYAEFSVVLAVGSENRGVCIQNLQRSGRKYQIL